MAESNAPPREEATPEAAFVEEIWAIVDKRSGRGNRGLAANLKRNAGRTLADARDALWIYRYLPHDRRWHENTYFLVATLMALHPTNPAATGGNFGAAMRKLSLGDEKSPVNRRFRVLLDAGFDSDERGRPAGGALAFRMRQLVKQLASKKIPVNWTDLLTDLTRWHYNDRRVQKKWADSYYRAPVNDSRDPKPEFEPATVTTPDQPSA